MQEIKKPTFRIPQAYLDFMNQIFEIEKKSASLKEDNSIHRNLNRMKVLLEEELFKGTQILGLTYRNPIGETYSDTRTDCEATIAGTEVENLSITEVIKPIIYCTYLENEKMIKVIIQPAVVIVQSK